MTSALVVVAEPHASNQSMPSLTRSISERNVPAFRAVGFQYARLPPTPGGMSRGSQAARSRDSRSDPDRRAAVPPVEPGDALGSPGHGTAGWTGSSLVSEPPAGERPVPVAAPPESSTGRRSWPEVSHPGLRCRDCCHPKSRGGSIELRRPGREPPRKGVFGMIRNLPAQAIRADLRRKLARRVISSSLSFQVNRM